MGHEHGHVADLVGVTQELHELVLVAQRDLAVGELQVAVVPQQGTQGAHLGLDRRARGRGGTWFASSPR